MAWSHLNTQVKRVIDDHTVDTIHSLVCPLSFFGDLFVKYETIDEVTGPMCILICILKSVILRSCFDNSSKTNSIEENNDKYLSGPHNCVNGTLKCFNFRPVIRNTFMKF